jgi:hypothetical protein
VNTELTPHDVDHCWCNPCVELRTIRVEFGKIKRATERLLAEHKTQLKLYFPDMNLKSHFRGCACEICEVELALGKRKEDMR